MYYFSQVAKNELDKELYKNPINAIYKPFRTITDFGWTLSSVVILPCYFLCLSLLVFAETISLIGSYFLYLLKEDNKQSRLDLIAIKESSQISAEILLLFFFIAPLMLFIFLCRLVITFIETMNLSEACTEKNKRQNARKKRTTAFSELNLLARIIHEDRLVIRRALDDYYAELDITSKQIDELFKTYNIFKSQLKKDPDYKEPQKEPVVSLEKENIDEMFELFKSISSNYPLSKFNKHSSLDEINAYYKDLDRHHEEVLSLAKILFPRLNDSLNEFKSRIDNLSINESSIFKI